MSSKFFAVCIGLTALAGLLAVNTVRAQGNQPTAPHQPLLPRAPEMSAWTVTYVYSSDKAHSRGKKTDFPKYRVTSVKFEKTGDTYHKTTTWDTGKQTEAWSVKGREVIKDKSDSEYVPTSATGPLADSFKDSDFEDLAWVSMKCYAGLEHGSRGNFVFRAKRNGRDLTRRETMAKQARDQLRAHNGGAKVQPLTNLSEEDADDATDDLDTDEEDTVILNETDQLPVEYDQGPVKWTYQFTTPPATPLALPTEVSTLLEHWDNFTKASEPAVSRP